MQTPHGQVAWSELMTRDVEAAKAYYSATCGWVYETMKMESGGDYFIAMAGDKPAGGIMDMSELPGMDDVPSHWFTYIAVDDVDAAVQKTSDMNGVVLRPPFDVPGIGRIAMLKDPSGAAMGMITEAEQS